jgi:isochorismate synthase
MRDTSGLRGLTIRLDPETADEIEVATTGIAESVAFGLSGRTDRTDRTVVASLRERGTIFRSSGRVMVCLGAAARFELGSWKRDAGSIKKGLAPIDCEDPLGRPGSCPIAIGALPFDPRSPAELVVPELTFVRDTDGEAWLTLTGHGPLGIPGLGLEMPAPRGRVASASAAQEIVDSERDTYVDAVEKALRQIDNGKVAKVVLARKVSVRYAERVDIGRILARLRSREASGTIFSISSPGHAFVGASPELIVARTGAEVTSVPLAGSMPMTGDRDSDERAAASMAASSKENFEHRLVVEAVEAELSKWCGSVKVQEEPEVMWLRQIAHLATPVSGTLEGESGAWPTAFELAAALHPTPAVCGSPAEAALELIGELEPEGRGLYAGLVGWVDSSGDGEFFLGIRSAEIRDEVATVHGGAGIVAGSDPGSELYETSVKLETMLAALTPD